MTPLPITEPPPDSVRSCGDCQACCEVLSVRPFSTDDGHEVAASANEPVLSKRFERCQWQCDKGCAIYAHRPSPCAAYHCMWRLGWGGDDARPDRLGLVAEGAPNGWAFFLECRPGAAQDPLFAAYVEAMLTHPTSRATAIHVTTWGEEDPTGGYWIGDGPADFTAEAAAVYEEIRGRREGL